MGRLSITGSEARRSYEAPRTRDSRDAVQLLPVGSRYGALTPAARGSYGVESYRDGATTRESGVPTELWPLSRVCIRILVLGTSRESPRYRSCCPSQAAVLA